MRQKNLASKHKKSRKRKGVSSWCESDQEEPVFTDADNSDWQDEEADCICCTGLLSQDMTGEKWVQCVKCSRSAHEYCAEKISVHYTCDLCLR
jgi:hypothetical protein